MSHSVESTGPMNFSDKGIGMEFNKSAYQSFLNISSKYLNNTSEFSSFRGRNSLNGENRVASDCVYQNVGKQWTTFILINFTVMFVLPITVSVELK